MPKHVLHAVAFYILGALVSITTFSIKEIEKARENPTGENKVFDYYLLYGNNL